MIHLSTPTEHTTARVNRPVNYGLWVVMTCLSCIIDCNKHTAPVGACVEAEGTSESENCLLNLAVNLKLKKFTF